MKAEPKSTNGTKSDQPARWITAVDRLPFPSEVEAVVSEVIEQLGAIEAEANDLVLGGESAAKPEHVGIVVRCIAESAVARLQGLERYAREESVQHHEQRQDLTASRGLRQNTPHSAKVGKAATPTVHAGNS